MDVQRVIDVATQPNIAVPVTTGGALAAALMKNLPLVTMIGWAIYVVLVVTHKAWTMYREWRDDPIAPGKGWFKK